MSYHHFPYYHPHYVANAVAPQVHAYPTNAYMPMPQMQQMYHTPYAHAYHPMPQNLTAHHTQAPLFNFNNDRFMKGLMIGAAAAYLLHNESVQRSAIKGAVNLWGSVQGSVEELKERFRDAEAELHAGLTGENR